MRVQRGVIAVGNTRFSSRTMLQIITQRGRLFLQQKTAKAQKLSGIVSRGVPADYFTSASPLRLVRRGHVFAFLRQQ